jgi:DNA processing protein
MTPADALLRLALVPGLGPVTAARLLAAVDDPAQLFSWTMGRLQEIDGVGAERARRIVDPRGAELLVAERAAAAGLGVRIITQLEADYPADLRRLSDPPLALWLRGELQPRDRLAVAVVGPRRPSAYGHNQARRLAGGLARLGCCIVSGLARGIDTVAHEAALDSGAGRTVAVLGSGFGRLYPEENMSLAERIAAGRGCLISEFPCQQPPSTGTFPRRNRIVACLSLATLVVEAGDRSGALITARNAGELGREVLVVPGPVDRPEYVGCHRLIRDGATLVTSVDDIVAEVGPLATLAAAGPPAEAAPPGELRAANLSGRERDLYRLLDDRPRTVDELAATTKLPASSVQAVLITLEIRRLARRQPGGFVRAH